MTADSNANLPTIALFNFGRVRTSEVQVAVAAVNSQILEDFFPIWKRAGSWRLVQPLMAVTTGDVSLPRRVRSEGESTQVKFAANRLGVPGGQRSVLSGTGQHARWVYAPIASEHPAHSG